MARVVVVHGVGKEFLGPNLIGQDVEAALLDGVRLAAGPLLGPADVSCAFYGDLFLKEGTRSLDLPPWDESDVDEGLESELLQAWWERASEVDAGVPAPDASGTRGPVGYGASRLLHVQRVRAALDALSASPFFARVSDRLLIFALKQVRRYLTEPDTRQRARARVAEEITQDTRVVVAHSLGSVVAYETLCALPDSPVTDFVTLGSPLGLRGVVFDRLQPAPVDGKGVWPGTVRRWTNVADRGDVVALTDRLAPRFDDRVEDLPVANGMRMHDIARYLTAPKTGRAIARGLED